MKILFFIPSLQTGGAERVVSILASNFAEIQGITVIICILNNKNRAFSLHEDIQVIAIGHMQKNKYLDRFLSLFRLRRLIKDSKPDIIQSFITESNIICLISSLGLNSNIYISDRSNPLKKLNPLTEFLRNIIYNKAQGIISQTILAKKSLENKGISTDIAVIPNPVKIPVLNENFSKEKIIINVGRLIPEKGQMQLLKAFENIGKKNEWKLIILGEGPLQEELSSYIKQRKLQNVHLLGNVKNIESYYIKSSIFAFSSLSEGYPNAIAEAMSFGLPVLSYDCIAGPSELIKDGQNGFLTKVGDINDFSQKLSFLIDNPEIRNQLGNQARKDIMKNSEFEISKNWYDFITKKSYQNQ